MHNRLIISTCCLALAGLYAFAESPIWRATRTSSYDPSELNPSELVLTTTSTLTYDNRGNALETVETDVIDGGRTRKTCTYDESGRMLTEINESLNAGEWVKTSSKGRAYDERTGIVIENLEYSYVDGVEYPGNCYRRTITRNEDGNVTNVELAVLFNGEFDPTRRMEVTYDEATGKATEIINLELTYNGVNYTWINGPRYTGLEWFKTDGQIVSSEDLFRGENLISKGHYVNDNAGKPYHDYDIEVTYGDNGVDYVSEWKGLFQGIDDTGVRREYIEESTAANGTKITLETSYYSLTDNTIPAENYLDVMVVDSFGIEVESSEYYWEDDNYDDRELLISINADVVYDETYGYPLEFTVTEDGEPFKRVEYSDYVDCTGIDSSISRPQVAAGVTSEWFDLTGRSVSNPSGGVYLHRQNGKTVKLLVK